MNWGQNKFLIGFGVVMVLGCGALGGLLWQSTAQFSELSAQYDEQVNTLQQLQILPLYPEQGNLQKLKDQKQVVTDAGLALQKQLEPLMFPMEQITPEQFQDKLRATVSAVVEKAGGVGVKLPDKFYLGFNDYQSKPPRTEAAAVLYRQLKAVDLAVNTLIDNKVDAIATINRTPLPEEADAPKVPAGKPAGKAKPVLLSKFPFEIQFSSEQAHFRRALNELARSEKQFFVIRPLSIKNTVEKPLLKTDPSASAAPVDTTATGDASQAPKAQSRRYVVGMEKLNVTLRLEMVVFASSSPK